VHSSPVTGAGLDRRSSPKNPGQVSPKPPPLLLSKGIQDDVLNQLCRVAGR